MEWADIPHFALRTPGYPLLLAACQAVFGERTLPVRLVQAVLGTLCVYLVYRLARQFVGSRTGIPSRRTRLPTRRRWTIPLIAAAMAAVNPHYLLMSSLILSEAVFEPLMLAALLGVAVLWPRRGRRAARPSARMAIRLVALGSGAAAGAAVLVRPSWALFVPAMLAAWIIASRRDRRQAWSRRCAARSSAPSGSWRSWRPWWVRNARVYGRFVPTAFWMGASLYDGLNPEATGASDMIVPARSRDLAARRAGPGRRADPAGDRVRPRAAGAGPRRWRWSSWAGTGAPGPMPRGSARAVVAVASAVVELPILGLMARGPLGPPPRSPRLGAARRADPLFLRAAHGLRQLDALPDPRRDARAGAGGDRLGEAPAAQASVAGAGSDRRSGLG